MATEVGPSWYRDTEQWLMDHGGRGIITAFLPAVVAISLWLIYEMWVNDRYVLPAAA